MVMGALLMFRVRSPHAVNMIIMHIQANKGNFMEISFVEEQVEVGDDQDL
jgi:hypothetical protein